MSNVNWELVNKLKEKVQKKNEDRLRKMGYHARKEYELNVINGDWSVYVPEWSGEDLWEKYEEEIIKSKEKIRGEIFMSKERILIRLSKDYHNFEYEVSDIDPNIEDVKELRNKGLEFAMESVAMLPNELKSTKKVSAETHVKKDYTPKTTVKPTTKGKYTKEDITTQYIKGGQVKWALVGLNEGRISLEELNNSSSWDETQAIVFPKK